MPSPADLVRNLVVLGLLWWAYSLVRSLGSTAERVAVSNAEMVLAFQTGLVGLAIESELQRVFGFIPLFKAANIYYLVHFPATLVVLVLAFLQARDHVFLRFRNALVGSTAVALIIHVLFPLAPPRMMRGFLDTGAVFGPDPYALPGSQVTNQFAAMPSMHVGWAVLVMLCAFAMSGDRRVRLLAVLHPILTTFTVLLTANHYVLDLIVGALLASAAWLIVGAMLDQVSEPAPVSEPAQAT